jgi:hypothetical protein
VNRQSSALVSNRIMTGRRRRSRFDRAKPRNMLAELRSRLRPFADAVNADAADRANRLVNNFSLPLQSLTADGFISFDVAQECVSALHGRDRQDWTAGRLRATML